MIISHPSTPSAPLRGKTAPPPGLSFLCWSPWGWAFPSLPARIRSGLSGFSAGGITPSYPKCSTGSPALSPSPWRSSRWCLASPPPLPGWFSPSARRCAPLGTTAKASQPPLHFAGSGRRLLFYFCRHLWGQLQPDALCLACRAHRPAQQCRGTGPRLRGFDR